MEAVNNMVERIFALVLSQSITASLVIIYVLLVRLFLIKSDKIFSYMLWSIVLFRLLCPFSFETSVSAIPNTYEYVTTITTNSTSTAPTYEAIEHPVTTEMIEPIVMSQDINWIKVAGIIWAVGAVSMALYGVLSYIKLQKSLVGYTKFKENIYLSDNISLPFVMGIFSPKIFLPSSLIGPNSDFSYNLDYIICHENTHIKRLDHITRILGFVSLAIHWFNPLVWLAFVLSAKDMEMSCDQTVLKQNNKLCVDIRKDYSHSLLYFAANHHNKVNLLSVTPHAFGDGGKNTTKERITNIMTYKKPILWLSSLALVAVVGTTVALATTHTTDNPRDDTVNAQMSLSTNTIEDKLFDHFDLAFQTFKTLDMSTLNFDSEDMAIIDGKTYFATTDFTSADDLNQYLSTLFTADVITQFSTIDTLYAEQDGKLYVIPADRGANINYGKELSRRIELVDDNRAVIYIEIESNQMADVSLAETVTFQFICENISDAWIFSQFPRIY